MQKELRLAKDSVRGLKGIVPYGTAGGKAGVDDRSPTFESVVVIMVKDIGNADGCGGAGHFNRCEGGMIVHNVVVEKRFIATTAAKIKCGRIIESTGSPHSDEEKIIFAVPEAMLWNRHFGLGCNDALACADADRFFRRMQSGLIGAFGQPLATESRRSAN